MVPIHKKLSCRFNHQEVQATRRIDSPSEEKTEIRKSSAVTQGPILSTGVLDLIGQEVKKGQSSRSFRVNPEKEHLACGGNSWWRMARSRNDCEPHSIAPTAAQSPNARFLVPVPGEKLASHSLRGFDYKVPANFVRNLLRQAAKQLHKAVIAASSE